MKKKRDLKTLNASELQTELASGLKELVGERAVAKQSGKPSSPGVIKNLRRGVARIKTLLKQKGFIESKK